ncbi:hypothetical protein DAI22_12g075500 [Oryza sativa Japonica Group]|nr:hypothetical protein DAI22_12g075500 [Oryza sativa Japonica Group]
MQMVTMTTIRPEPIYRRIATKKFWCACRRIIEQPRRLIPKLLFILSINSNCICCHS